MKLPPSIRPNSSLSNSESEIYMRQLMDRSSLKEVLMFDE